MKLIYPFHLLTCVYLIIHDHKSLVHISEQTQGPAFERMLDTHMKAVELYNNAFIL